MQNKKKVVLAYSGGLDTTYCAVYLAHEMNMEVYSVMGNTGGFSNHELFQIENTAHQLGVKSHLNLDLRNEYYENCIKYMTYGNILRNNTYPLSVSSERIIQAIAIAKYALEIGADYIAHGSTGSGNDQIRFDVIFKTIAPKIEIITPVRDLNLSRTEEITYLKSKGIDKDFQKNEYSINVGIWGSSIGGKETLSSDKSIPESAYINPITKKGNEILKLKFEKGEINEVNGTKYENPIQAIKEIDKIGSSYGIGRDIHVGDTIIGTKGRVAFEAAAALIIIKSHQLLEKHTLSKWQIYWKEQLSNWYGMFLHEAQYLEPVMRNIESFLEASQLNVNGEVIIKLYRKGFELVGVNSENDLMTKEFGDYGESNPMWSSEDIKGYTNILANATKVFFSVNKK